MSKTKARHDRIYSLSELNSYSGSDFFDMVFYYPRCEAKKLRCWIKTNAENPIVKIDDIELYAREKYGSRHRWLDLGITEQLRGHFSQLRIFNTTFKEAVESHFVVTSDIDMIFESDLQKTYQNMFGISPAKVGFSMISPSTVQTGKEVAFKLLYTASEDLPKGSRIRFSTPYAFSNPQTTDSKEPGYFECGGDETIIIEKIETRFIESHERNIVVCLLPDGMKKGEMLTVNYATENTYLFSNSFKETVCSYWYSKLPVLSVEVAVDNRELYVPILGKNSHKVSYVSGKCERLNLILPSRRKTVKVNVLKGVYTDRLRNYPPNSRPDMNIKILLLGNGKKLDLGKPEGMWKDFYRFEMTLPRLDEGIYRAVAVAERGNIIARSNPMEIADGKEEVYFGEIHCHSSQSDGSGEYERLFRYARDIAGIDFAAAADHACYFSDNEWEIMTDVSNSFNEDSIFTALNGYEWAGNQVHRNIYTSRGKLKLFRGMYEPTSELKTVTDSFDGDNEVALGGHGSVAHGMVWDSHNGNVERFIEMYSMWGANDFPESEYFPKELVNCKSLTVNEILNTGALLGFTGGGDCHEGLCGMPVQDDERQGEVPHIFARDLKYRCGLTGAFLKELNRKSLIEAIRNRKTYATTGARILLYYTIGELRMGDIGFSGDHIIKISVSGSEPITEIRIIENGKVVRKIAVDDYDINIEAELEAASRERVYYYVQVKQKDGHMAWGSPIWVKKECSKMVNNTVNKPENAKK